MFSMFKRDHEIKDLQISIAELSQAIEELSLLTTALLKEMRQAKTKRKPGRPKKVKKDEAANA